MKRLFAILLFAAFVLPIVAPAFALGQDADAGLPACCRRNGAHHCAMSMGERTQLSKSEIASKTPRWQMPAAHCPCCPACPTASHANILIAPATQTTLAAAFSHPAGTVQTESRWRIARDRSRQKRGPPASSSVSTT